MNFKADLDKQIYLDACSTTPIRLEVIEYMSYINKCIWGNPSSLHRVGLLSAEVLERSRKNITNCLSADLSDIVFTSGSTESIYLAILGSARSISPGRLVISSIEHPAVVAASKELKRLGWNIALWPVDHLGALKLEMADELLSPPTKLVSIIWGQSEIGTIQDIENIGQLCHDRGVLLHADATQILANQLFSWNELPVDFLSASAHKFQGPKGIGFLLYRSENTNILSPRQLGGGQEQGIRGGTEAVHLIAGMSVAVDLLKSETHSKEHNQAYSSERVRSLTAELRRGIENIPQIKFTGHPSKRLINHISMLVANKHNEPISGREVVRQLSRLNICASSGNACQSGKLTESAVLAAIGVSPEWRMSGLRFSLGPWLKQSDIMNIPENLCKAIEMSTYNNN